MIELLVEAVERGRKGEVKHLKLTDYKKPAKLASALAFGSGRYMVVAGPPGNGKTAFVDSMFVLKPVLDAIKGGREVNYIYRSMERSTQEKLAKWYCGILFHERGEVLDPATLLSYGNAERLLRQDDIEKMLSFKDLFSEIEKRVDIITGEARASSIFKYAEKRALSRGLLYLGAENGVTVGKETYEYDGVMTRGGLPKRYRTFSFGKVFEGDTKYLANDDAVYIHVTDHVGLITDGEEKRMLDMHSNGMKRLRDTYEYGIIDILQLNRDIENTYRQVKQALKIKMSDIKGTGTFSQNADLILAIIDPHYYEQREYFGYDIPRLVDEKNRSRMRMLFGIKNSQGLNPFQKALFFEGASGWVYELPKAEDMDSYTYQQIVNLTYRP